MTSIGAELTSLETRVDVLEQRLSSAIAPGVKVTPSPTTGQPVITDSLTFDAGWANHTKINVGQPNPALPNYPSLSWVHYTGAATLYGGGQAIRVGTMCFLTGLIVRTGALIQAGQGDTRMFMLPTGWRPILRWILSGTLISGTPSSGIPGLARIEVRPDTGSAAGGVYYQYANADISASSWIALSGAFPCVDRP